MNLNLRWKSFSLAAALLCASSAAAFADTFTFTFDDGPTSYFYTRDHLPGGRVSGVLYGLSDNAWSMPTSIAITYADPGLDLTLGSLSNITEWGTGFLETGGQITAANFGVNFDDSAGHSFQLRLDDQTDVVVDGANWLIWNGGTGPFTGVGNTGGFPGAQYAPLTSAVPEPSTWGMMLLGFAGLGVLAWRRKARTVSMVG